MVAANPEGDRRGCVIYKNASNVRRPRQPIIDHLASFWIEPRHLMRDHRSGPCVLIFVQYYIVGGCPPRVEFPLLELFCFGIEHSDSIAAVLAKPEAILSVHAS